MLITPQFGVGSPIHGPDEESLFFKALQRGKRAEWLARLIGGCRTLISLESVTKRHIVADAGTKIVPIADIRGSVNRSNDFDKDFQPRRVDMRERWMRVAHAMRQGQVMPPVELVQVGNVYYVVDGHHRVSVARMLNQAYIDAIVKIGSPG